MSSQKVNWFKAPFVTKLAFRNRLASLLKIPRSNRYPEFRWTSLPIRHFIIDLCINLSLWAEDLKLTFSKQSSRHMFHCRPSVSDLTS